eukprot:scaffold103721_cov30-Phaeocystis_antarctica.AAC.1
MQQCRRVVRVTRGGASRSPVCCSVVGVRCGRSWWVSRSTQGSTPETHRCVVSAANRKCRRANTEDPPSSTQATRRRAGPPRPHRPADARAATKAAPRVITYDWRKGAGRERDR